MRVNLARRVEELEREVLALIAEQTNAGELAKFSRYYGRELDFCREQLLDRRGKAKRYWSGQEAIFRALHEHRRVAIRSPHKGGKTEALGDVAIAYLQTGPTIVISTAAGARQVETGLWSRIGAQFHRARETLLGRLLTTELKVAPDWFGIGFSTNDPNAFQGAHSGIEIPDEEGVVAATPEEIAEAIDRAAFEVAKKSNTKRLVMLFDEAPGVDERIYEASKGSTLGEHTYVILAGNPTIEFEEDHEFARAHHAGSGYYRIKFTAPEDGEEPDPVDADEVHVVPPYIATREDYDTLFPPGSPSRGPRAFGRFRNGDTSGRVIPYAYLTAAAEPKETNLVRGVHMGVDTAGDGDDKNVCSLFVDSVMVSVDSWHSQDTLATWGRIKQLRTHWENLAGRPIAWPSVHIDDAPIAKGIIDLARAQKCDIHAVKFGEAPSGSWREIMGDVQFANRRSEMYYALRELLRQGFACIPAQYRETWRQLAAHNYHYRTGTTIVVIEPKKDVKKRLGCSPDFGDSAVLAFANAPRLGFSRTDRV